MVLKLIALLAAAIPVILFLRAMLGRRRPSKLGTMMSEAKKQVDLAIWIFLALIGCVLVAALGKIGWAWWTAA